MYRQCVRHVYASNYYHISQQLTHFSHNGTSLGKAVGILIHTHPRQECKKNIKTMMERKKEINKTEKNELVYLGCLAQSGPKPPWVVVVIVMPACWRRHLLILLDSQPATTRAVARGLIQLKISSHQYGNKISFYHHGYSHWGLIVVWPFWTKDALCVWSTIEIPYR